MNGEPQPAGVQMSRRRAAVLVAGLTLLAGLLRLFRLGSDLWLDEIAPLVMYGDHSPFEIWGDLARPNNHMLNTLLVNSMRALCGDSEWAVRLPAAAFGFATVPVFYRLSRFAVERPAAVVAAALLAISPHHVFYSQSARGYSAHVFFVCALTLLLLAGLRRPARRATTPYMGVAALGFAAHPLSVVTYGTHVGIATAGRLVGGKAWFAQRRRWLLLALGGAAATAIVVFSPGLQGLVSGVRSSFIEDRIGFSPLSLNFLNELSRGLAGGSLPLFLAGAALAVPVLAIGIASVGRQSWELAASLLVPPVLIVIGVAAVRGTIYPRFLIAALPAAILFLVAGSEQLACSLAGAVSLDQRKVRQGALIALPLLALVVSIPMLVQLYETPKQSYRAALTFLSGEIDSDRTVVVADLAVAGFRHYAQQVGLAEPRLVMAREEAAVIEALERESTADVLIVTTLDRNLGSRAPRLAALLERDWHEQMVFPASVAGGEIRIWSRRTAGE